MHKCMRAYACPYMCVYACMSVWTFNTCISMRAYIFMCMHACMYIWRPPSIEVAFAGFAPPPPPPPILKSFLRLWISRKAAFHQGLHCVLRQKIFSGQPINTIFMLENVWRLKLYNELSLHDCIKLYGKFKFSTVKQPENMFHRMYLLYSYLFDKRIVT